MLVEVLSKIRVLRGVLARVPKEVSMKENNLRERSPEHPDFGEHPDEHSRELFWGVFPFSTSLPGQEVPYPSLHTVDFLRGLETPLKLLSIFFKTRTLRAKAKRV